MSGSPSRWPAVLLLGAAWAAMGATAGTAAPPEQSEQSDSFDPPLDQPMLLSRTLRRDLADGKQIVATRRYRVRFVREGSGWRVDGELVASEIEAPEALRAFAELERTRPDDGLFPLRLNGRGLIEPREESPTGDQGSQAVQQAVTLAAARLGAGAKSAASPASPSIFLTQIQALAAAAVTTQWPTSLFRPEHGAIRHENLFALPDGNQGILISEIDAVPSPNYATMAQLERRIITEIAGNRRISREQWKLEALPGAG